MTALVGPAHAEAAAYLRVVYGTAPVVRERVEEVLQLPPLYLNLLLLEVAQLAPAVLQRALIEVDRLGCLVCEHDRHEAGDCLEAMTDADGDDTYCLCGMQR